jgi:hypothetical protein
LQLIHHQLNGASRTTRPGGGGLRNEVEQSHRKLLVSTRSVAHCQRREMAADPLAGVVRTLQPVAPHKV